MASSLFPSRSGAPAAGPLRTSPGGGLNIQAIQSVKRMMNTFKRAKNPDAAMQMLAQQNPQIAGILRLCGPGGLKNGFYQMCQEQGVDPEEVLRQLQRYKRGAHRL